MAAITEIITVKLPPELVAQVRRLAGERGVTTTAAVGEALRAWVAEKGGKA